MTNFQRIVDTLYAAGSASEKALFFANLLVLIGWLALLITPRSRYTTLACVAPALALSFLYTVLLIDTAASSGFPDFFSIGGWLAAMSSRKQVMAATYHFSLMDLMVGLAITKHFYANYEVGKFSRAVFTVILLCSYVIGPAGFLLYHVSRRLIFADSQLLPGARPRHLAGDLKDKIPSGHPWVDALPALARRLIRLVNGLLGGVALLAMFTAYAVFIAACFVYWVAARRPFRRLAGRVWPFEFVVVPAAHLRLWWTLTARKSAPLRALFWWLPYLLEFSFFAEFLPFAEDPVPYINALEGEFGPRFPFGDGIGFSAHADVKRTLEDPRIRKGPESLAWKISSSQYVFSRYTSVYYPQGTSDNTNVLNGRDIVRAWLREVPSISSKNVQARLDTILPYRPADGSMLDKSHVERAFGMAMFHLLTGGELTKEEIVAYDGAVNNFAPFLPDWINFLAGGGLLERQGMKGYEALRDALVRYPNARTLTSALLKSKALGWEPGETVRFLTTVYAVAGAAAPAKLLSAVVGRMFENPAEMVPLYLKDKQRFIKECARLNRCVPLVNMFTYDSSMTVEIRGKNHVLPENTALHCSIVSANRDASIFGESADRFDVDRESLLSILTWNGTESTILQDEVNLRAGCPMKSGSLPLGDHPPRRCQGHSFALEIIEFLVDRYRPQAQADQTLDDAEYAAVVGKQSLYTRALLEGAQKFISEWNTNPPHASDALHPADAYQKNLGDKLLVFGDTAPSYDEDDPPNPLVPLVGELLGNPLASVSDPVHEWSSAEQAVGFRIREFGSSFPPPNIKYTEMSSGEALSHLAFAGLCSFRTKKASSYPEDHVVSIHRPQEAVYVSESVFLSSYNVRASYQRYGAIAYFDQDCNICAIYTCCNGQLTNAPPPSTAPADASNEWKHAVWVWKVSAIALVTVGDHLFQTHLVEANALCYASRRHLSPDHPLRAFLKIFTYRTVSINYASYQTLSCRKGLVERIWAFEGDDLQKMFVDLKKAYKFVPLPERIDHSMSNLEDSCYPMNQDVKQFWGIVKTLVHDYLKVIYRNERELRQDEEFQACLRDIAGRLCLEDRQISTFDGVVNVLSGLLCAVTGFHEHVGQISDYFVNPTFGGTTLRAGMEIDDIQTYSMKVALVSLTGLRVPRLLDDWDHLLNRGKLADESIKVFRQFQADLLCLSEDVNTRNPRRRFACESFDSMLMESSVSI